MLLNAMYDGERGENYLLVLDARSLTQLASVYLPSEDREGDYNRTTAAAKPLHLMGFGIHSRFFGSAQCP